VVYSVAASLDGYIAGPRGESDWILMDPSLDWKAFMGRFDTVLLGRKTFEVAGGKSGGSMPGMSAYVFSTTLKSAEHPRLNIVAKDAAQFVSELKRQPGKEIWLMGGGGLFRSLLEAGVVDRIEVALIPILLGEGLPLLPVMPRKTRLALFESKALSNGTVMLHYDVHR